MEKLFWKPKIFLCKSGGDQGFQYVVVPGKCFWEEYVEQGDNEEIPQLMVLETGFS